MGGRNSWHADAVAAPASDEGSGGTQSLGSMCDGVLFNVLHVLTLRDRAACACTCVRLREFLGGSGFWESLVINRAALGGARCNDSVLRCLVGQAAGRLRRLEVDSALVSPAGVVTAARANPGLVRFMLFFCFPKFCSSNFLIHFFLRAA